MTFVKGQPQPCQFQKGNVPWIKGKHHTTETKKRISESEKGYKPWRYVVAGWNKSIPRTDKEKEIQRQKMLGKPGPNKGKPMTKEARLKMQITRKKQGSPWMKGRKFSEQHRENLSISHKGEKSYTWKGGITPIHHLIRTSMQYRHWRIAVKKRDNSRCIWCYTTENLHVDHIKPFAYFPELRFELSNGRTLCVNCHKKTDTWGYKNL